MGDYYDNRKQYCQEGESDSVVALGWAILAMCVTFVLFLIGIFVFL